MQQITNGLLQITITEKGAELESILNTQTGLEYLWNADPAFWPKKSPVLFPIVGGLKDNAYRYQGKNYQLGRHGFARESVYAVSAQTENSITYTLTTNVATANIYPFDFSFSVTYTIDGNTLFCSYEVENRGSEALYFSCGGHPAFNIPLTKETGFTDWYLQFEQVENTPRWPIGPDGLILDHSIPCLENTNRLPLTKPLFYGDALVFKDLKSTSISILSDKSENGLTMNFEGFPYYGIWSFKDADFVCLEPWCGIADTINSTGVLQEKEGIIFLEPNNIWKRGWDVAFF